MFFFFMNCPPPRPTRTDPPCPYKTRVRSVDTTNYSSNDWQQEIRQRFGEAGDGEPVLNILSFGFARGLPRNADLVFDMRYLRNPHWDPKLKPGTGLDDDVAAYVVADPAY